MNEIRPHCPLTFAVKAISGKWKLLILNALTAGPKRFGELRRECENITEKMLTSQLKELERDELIHREVFAQVPPKVEYSLTPLGHELNAVFDPLYKWGVKYMQQTKPDQLHLIDQFFQAKQQTK
jgi:DNA-binding HxlR family transcriptional regulator